VLHDPQTAGMVDALKERGAHVLWRCHIGSDSSNEHTDLGWAFLRPLIENADRFVFSRHG
jgi:trehalose synthase